MQFLSADLLQVFGLDWKSMLFYLVNFLLLLGALIGLLYKPVKKMLKNKQKDLDDVYTENARLKAESEQSRAEYEKMLADMKRENARVAATVAAAAQEKADAIIADAQAQAQAIIATAKQETASQSEQLKGEFRDSVNRLALQIAQKLLEREVSDNDNARLIEQVLSDWENV